MLRSKRLLSLTGSICLILVLALLLLPACAQKAAPAPTLTAEKYPARVIEVIVPLAAGGGTDRIDRALAGTWGAYCDFPLRIINMPGGGGVDGHLFGAKAKPDGYTLIGTGTILLPTPLMRPEVGFTLESFEPLFNIVAYSHFIVVPKDSPFKTLKDLVDYAKANPGKLKYGSSGVGSDLHIGMEIFARKAGGLQMTNVPLEGGAEQLAMVMGGHIDCAFGTSASFVPAIKDGSVRALAITANARHKDLKDIPTVKEAIGVDMEYLGFRCILAPAGISKERIDFLSVTGGKCLADEALISMIGKFGEDPAFMDAPTFKQWIYKQRDDYIPVVAAIKAQTK